MAAAYREQLVVLHVAQADVDGRHGDCNSHPILLRRPTLLGDLGQQLLSDTHKHARSEGVWHTIHDRGAAVRHRYGIHVPQYRGHGVTS